MGSEQKVAVITGASGGIGAALVKAYRDRNYRVVATARSMEPLSGDDVVVVSGDIADRKTAERAISEGTARFGPIDTLVNNAGIFIAKPFTQYTEADYAALLGVNVMGFFHITQLAIAEMEKQGSEMTRCATTGLKVLWRLAFSLNAISRTKGIKAQFPHGNVSSVSFVSTTNTARSLAGFVLLALALTSWRSPGNSEKLYPALKVVTGPSLT